jgi:hypothetical protein
MVLQRQLRLALVALVLLIGSLGPTVQSFTPHAESCPVESHCLVCRHTLGATATLAVQAPAPALFTPVVAAAPAPPAQEIDRPRPAVPARAPPVADQV